MVKRGIGAATLAILAALLLGYLLKDKGQEREEVVNMTLPGASEVKDSLNIPALKGSDGIKNLTQKGEEEVVASAEGAADKVNEATKDLKVKEVAVNTFKNKGEDLDFTVRPPKGEKREIVDNIGKSRQDTAESSGETLRDDGDIAASASAAGTRQNSSSGSISRSTPSEGTVVASSAEKGYRPRLVDEKRRSANYGLDDSSELTRREKKELREKRRAERRAAEEERKNKADQEDQADKGHYAIQLLATSSSSRANKLKNVMGEEGYPTRVSKTNGDGKVLFRVRIGNYSSREGAVSAQRTMQRRYKRNQYVNDSIIVAR